MFTKNGSGACCVSTIINNINKSGNPIIIRVVYKTKFHTIICKKLKAVSEISISLTGISVKNDRPLRKLGTAVAVS